MIKRLRGLLLVYGFFLLVAVLITWPLLSQLGTHLVGFEYGDSTEMARHIWWYNHALRSGQPIFWQSSLGYPDGIDGSLLWADPLQFFPAWLLAFALPVVAAANLTILLTMALNGWAMYALARHLFEGHQAPALLAGLVFMAAPTFQGHLGGGHAGLMVMWPVPLLIDALLHLRQIPKRRWFVLAVIFFALSPGGHGIQSIYVLMPLMAIIILMRLWQRDWTGLRQTFLVAFFGSLILLVFLVPLAWSAVTTPVYRDEGGFVRYSADLLSIVTPSFFHPLYSHLDYPARVLGVNLEEGSSYIGIVAGLLALLAVFRVKQARWWLILALVAWLLSLGPLLKVFDAPLILRTDGYETYLTLPWAFVQNLPLFSLARTPGRFNFTLALAVGLLAGFGADWLVSRIPVRLRRVLPLMLMALILLDYQWYWPFPTFSAEIPAAVYALAERADVRAVLDLPWENPVAAKQALYLQTAHQKPLVGGHTTRSTPVSPAKLTLLERTLDPAMLKFTGADIVIWHKPYASKELLTLARSQLGAPLYEDSAFAIFETPSAGSAPAFSALVSDQTRIETSAESYVYAPERGWVTFSGTLSADDRDVALYLDQELIHRWNVDGEQAFAVPVPVEAEHFHSITLAVDPPCPASYGPTLTCRAVKLSDVLLDDYAPASLETVAFDRGLELLGSRLQVQDHHLEAGLWWAFAAPRQETDIRFVHVIDSEGNMVAQDDQPLGQQAAGAHWAEQVSIDLADDLPAGDYRVLRGLVQLPGPDALRRAF